MLRKLICTNLPYGVLISGVLLAAPAMSQVPITASTTTGVSTTSVPTTAAPQVASAAVNPTTISGTPDSSYEYRLGSGDRIRVIVFGEPDLSNEFSISGDGMVSLPLIGDVPAAGSTAAQLQTRIATALMQGYLKDPKVNVEVMTFRPFYILGEVSKPGEYPFSNGMTIERAVATASGYTYRGDHKKVFIKHANQEKEVEVPLSSQVMIAPGDTIRIPERYF